MWDVSHPVPLLGGFHKQRMPHPSPKPPTVHLGDPQILTGVCDREATNVSGVNTEQQGHLPTSPARQLTSLTCLPNYTLTFFLLSFMLVHKTSV